MPDDSNPKALTFEPVPLKPRHDGWSPERQIAFITALAETACVEEACRRVGMSRQSAYALRWRPCGRAFRDAWDAALDFSLICSNRRGPHWARLAPAEDRVADAEALLTRRRSTKLQPSLGRGANRC